MSKFVGFFFVELGLELGIDEALASETSEKEACGKSKRAGCIEVDSKEISKFLLLLLGLVHKSQDSNLSWDIVRNR